MRGGRLSTKRVIVNSTDFTTLKAFADAVKRSLGSGISCKLRLDDLQDLLHQKVEDYHLHGGRTFRLIDRVGQQEDGVWVFKDCQFTKDGDPTSEDETGWVFNPRLGIEDEMPCPKLAEQNSQALQNLVDAARKFIGPTNIYPALITLGYGAMSVH